MNIKSFEKAQKIYNSIKELDAEIIELERQAMIVANNEVNVSFDIKIENLMPDVIGLDNIGAAGSPEITIKSLYDSLSRPSFYWYEAPKSEKQPDAPVLKNKISPYTALHILGLLLRDKQDKRECLLEKLKLMGLITN